MAAEGSTEREETVARRSRGATISDVAAHCGVAISTVSRALTRPGRVNEITRLRIVAAADELGYHPNPRARSLLSGRTDTLALLIPDITNPFFFDVIRGTQGQSAAAGYSLLLVDTEESSEVEARHIARLQKSVDGLILAAARLSDSELARAAEVPMVALNRNTPGVPTVVIDSAEGTVQAVEHLASLGHRTLAYAAGPTGSWSNVQRWRAVRAAAQRLGVTARRVGPFTPTVHAGAAAADAAFNVGATGVLAFNDLMAIGILQRLKERGIRVPADMSVVGCDDIFGADFCHPALTTLTAPIERAGRVATDMLLDQLGRGTGRSAPRKRERLPTNLTVRESTGPAPVR
ncbi:LacI family DNA-binding transcriptional regulator [Pseudonocardia sp. GCM10023141]|uniref:LacI family DNA-binding transcriptional regulator n=1 Tax=Pseudonocardia sp. GCM10023141 TaxID=3252653 RepID=UPI003613E27A